LKFFGGFQNLKTQAAFTNQFSSPGRGYKHGRGALGAVV